MISYILRTQDNIKQFTRCYIKTKTIELNYLKEIIHKKLENMIKLYCKYYCTYTFDFVIHKYENILISDQDEIYIEFSYK